MPIDRLRQHAGDIRQLVTAELFERLEGQGRGSRVARLAVPGGFDIEVLPDRGMDLGAVSWRGIPVAWISAAGPSAPDVLDPGSQGWLRAFRGGLLVTCGFDQFGAESVGESSVLPLHGRAHTLISSQFATWSKQVEDDWQVGARGQTRQATAFAENLRLTRSISTSLYTPEIRLTDIVTNDGHSKWPHMMLYHMNFGWPIISAGTTLSVGYLLNGEWTELNEPSPRDEAAAAGKLTWRMITEPAPTFPEQVFRFDFPAGAEVIVKINSPDVSLEVSVRFSASELHHLYVWKILQDGVNVIALEPANSPGIAGQESLRSNGLLPYIAPGESRNYGMTIAVREIP